MSGGVQGNDSRARASSATTSRCQSTHEMRQSGIMKRLSIRIVISEARCGSFEVAHFSVAACVRKSATRMSCYRCIRRCTTEHMTANQFNKASPRPVFWITVTPLRGTCMRPWLRARRADSVSRDNNSSPSDLADKVVEVMEQERRAKSSSVQNLRRRISSPA